ncbi:hypothetical protein FE257_012581 [Aspergillus nanangensis]|uniref:Carrier domain-containing protein n=1 Tax=Aspergillus nanangensis TaxID=2582783 RepID=A0AAD4CVD2_ASPNN|nr:hypothetical protein FE257_012581 [Aspergillus nanangensis]
MCTRRSQLPVRSFAVADSVEKLKQSLDQGLPSFPRTSRKNHTNIAFIFTGQGAQWAGMGQELLRCPWDIFEAVKADADNSRINQPDQSQTICCALQLALVDLLSSWGIFPRAVIGHSSGEIGAAYAAGHLSHEDAIKVAYLRGHYSVRLSERGGMLAAGISVEEVKPYLDALPPQSVVVACVNSPSSTTLSGDMEQIELLQKQLRDHKVFARKLQVDAAYHSPHMKELAEDYGESIESIVRQNKHQGTVAMVSSVTKDIVDPAELTAAYWVRNMISTVEFSGAVSRLVSLVESGKSRRRAVPVKWSAFVEVGPHKALKGPFHQTLQSSNDSLIALAYLAPVMRQQNALGTSLGVAGTLWSTGHAINLEAVNEGADNSNRLMMTTLPSYPWNHQSSFWHEPRESAKLRHRKHARHDLLGTALNYQNDLEPQWRHFLRISENPWIADHVVAGSIVFPAAGIVTMVIEAVRQLDDSKTYLEGIEFQDIQFLQDVVIPPDDQGLETLLHVMSHAGVPGWYEFTLSSLSEGGSWIRHATGAFACQNNAGLDPRDKSDWEQMAVKFKETQAVSKTTDIESVYDWLSQTAGVLLGPCFRSITQASFHPQPSRLWLSGTVSDTKRAMPYEHESPSLVHPTTLDALFKAAVLSNSEVLSNQDASIPVGVERLYISTAFQPQSGEQFAVHTETSRKDRELCSECIASDPTWSQPWIILQGVRLGRVPVRKAESSKDTGPESRYSSLVWAEHMESCHPKPLEVVCADYKAHHARNLDLEEWVGRFCHTYGDGRALFVGDTTGSWGVGLQRFAPRSGQRPCLLEATILSTGDEGADEEVKSPNATAENTLPGSTVLPVSTLGESNFFDTFQSTYGLLVISSLNKAYLTFESLLSLLGMGGWLIYKIPTAGLDKALQLMRQSQNIELKYLAKNDSLIVARKKPEPSVFGTGIYVVVPEQPQIVPQLLNDLEHLFIKFGVKLFPISMNDVAQVAGKTVISLLELQNPWVYNWSEGDMQCFQTLLKANYIIWVSQSPVHGSNLNAGFGATTGLLRTLRNERPGLTLVQLFLDGPADKPGFELARSVVQVMRITLRVNTPRPDMEFSFLDGRLLVPRVFESAPVQEAVNTLTYGPQPQSGSFSTDLKSLPPNFQAKNPRSSFWGEDKSQAVKHCQGSGTRSILSPQAEGNLQDSQKAALTLLNENGCQTNIVACDISKEEDVQKVASQAHDQGWEIRGITQCTTVLRDAMFDRMTHEEWIESTQSKIQGTLNLHQAFSDVDLEFFMALSSVAGVIGNIGQANYCAGNAFMDALMEWRHAHGLPGCSINIGLVPDAIGIGDVTESPEERRRRYTHLEGTEITRHEIQILLRTIIQGNHSVPAQVIAGMTDTLSHTSANSSWQFDRKFDHRIRFAPAEGGTLTISRSALLESSESRTAAAGIILKAIQEYLAQAMASTADAIDPDLPFSALGVDSLKVTEVQHWVMRELGAELSTFEFLGSQSLKAVVDKIVTLSSFVTVSV